MRRVMVTLVMLAGVSVLWAATSDFSSPSLLGEAVAADDPGGKLFDTKCSSCHGKDGKGKTKMGEKLKIKDLTSADVQKEFTDADAEKFITEGIEREGKLVMKPQKGLKPDEIKALVKYVRSLPTL